jgi:hypothetical protein
MKHIFTALYLAIFAGTILSTPIDINFTQDYYKSFINDKQQTEWFSVAGNPSLEIRLTETKGGTLKWAEENNSIPGYDSDGIGVDDDEIRETGQEIKIEFNQSVYLHEIEVLDLFYEQNNERQTSIVPEGYFEVGYYKTNGIEVPFYALNQDISLIGTQGVSPGLYGQLIKEVPNLLIDEIIFSSYEQQLEGNNDYAIANLTVSSAVPEPGITMLLGFGFLGMIGFRFRKKAI